jgi:hypothetical protein
MRKEFIFCPTLSIKMWIICPGPGKRLIRLGAAVGHSAWNNPLTHSVHLTDILLRFAFDLRSKPHAQVRSLPDPTRLFDFACHAVDVLASDGISPLIQMIAPFFDFSRSRSGPFLSGGYTTYRGNDLASTYPRWSFESLCF